MKVEEMVHPDPHRASESRTTGTEGHSCEQCGQLLTGRKKTFCSDACRMRNRRERQQQKVLDLLDAIERSVGALRAELEGRHEAT